MAIKIFKKLFASKTEEPGEAKPVVKEVEAAVCTGKKNNSASIKPTQKKKNSVSAKTVSDNKLRSKQTKGNTGNSGNSTDNTSVPPVKSEQSTNPAEKDPALSKRKRAFRWWGKRYAKAIQIAIANKELPKLQELYEKRVRDTPYCYDGNTQSKFFWYFNSWLFDAMRITDSVWSFNQANEKNEPDRIYRLLLIFKNNAQQGKQRKNGSNGNGAIKPILFDCYGHLNVVPIVNRGNFKLPKTPGTVVIVQGTKTGGKLLISEMLHLYMYEDGQCDVGRLQNGAYTRIVFSYSEGYSIPVSYSVEDFSADCYEAMMTVAERRLLSIKNVQHNRNSATKPAKPKRGEKKEQKNDLLICEQILAELSGMKTIEETGHTPGEAVIIYPDGKPVENIIDVKGSSVTTKTVRNFLSYNPDRERFYANIDKPDPALSLGYELCIREQDVVINPSEYEKNIASKIDFLYFLDPIRAMLIYGAYITVSGWDEKPCYFPVQWKKARLAYIPVFLQRFHRFINDENHAPVILPDTEEQQVNQCVDPIGEWYTEMGKWTEKIQQLSPEETEERYADDFTPNVTYIGPYMLTHPKSYSLYFLNRFWIEAHTENSLDEARLNYLLEMQDEGSTELPTGVYAVYIRSFTMNGNSITLRLADCWGSVTIHNMNISEKILSSLRGYLLLAEMTVVKDSAGEFSARVKKLMRSPFSIGKNGSFTIGRYDGNGYLFYENSSGKLTLLPVPSRFMQGEQEILLAAIEDIKKRSERNGSIIDGVYTGNPYWFKKRYPSLKPMAGYGTSDGKLRLFQYGISARSSSLHASLFEQEQTSPGTLVIEYLGRSEIAIEQDSYINCSTNQFYTYKKKAVYVGFGARTFSGELKKCVYEEALEDKPVFAGRGRKYYGPLFIADPREKDDMVTVMINKEGYTPRSDIFSEAGIDWLENTNPSSQSQRWYEYRFLLAEAEARMYCTAKPNDVYIMAYNDRRHRDVIPIPEERRFNAAVLRKFQQQKKAAD